MRPEILHFNKLLAGAPDVAAVGTTLRGQLHFSEFLHLSLESGEWSLTDLF